MHMWATKIQDRTKSSLKPVQTERMWEDDGFDMDDGIVFHVRPAPRFHRQCDVKHNGVSRHPRWVLPNKSNAPRRGEFRADLRQLLPVHPQAVRLRDSWRPAPIRLCGVGFCAKAHSSKAFPAFVAARGLASSSKEASRSRRAAAEMGIRNCQSATTWLSAGS